MHRVYVISIRKNQLRIILPPEAEKYRTERHLGDGEEGGDASKDIEVFY